MKQINYLPINWTDGVKYSSEHFFKNYNNILEIIKDYNAIGVKDYEYGLVPNSTGSLELDVLTDGDNSLVISLKYCDAIIEKGYRVLYSDGLYGDYKPSITLKASKFDRTESDSFYVVLSLSPFEYLPVGNPDPEVTPLHHPHVLPKIDLNVVSVSKINTGFLEGNFLVISKVLWVNGVFSIDKNYIPPVLSSMADKKLENFSKGLIQVLIEIKNYTIKIFKKNQKQKLGNLLVNNTLNVCRVLQDFYSDNIFALENISLKSSPIYLVDKLIVLANKLSICFNIMNDNEKEQLLQYYYQWTGIKPTDFLNEITDVVTLKYNHIEINECFECLKSFTSILIGIFKKMSELEHIGQRRDNIVINEELNTQDTTNRHGRSSSSWSLID